MAAQDRGRPASKFRFGAVATFAAELRRNQSQHTHGNCIDSMPMPKWLTIRNAAQDTTGPVELLIYGEIGADWFNNSGVEAKAFVDALRSVPASREIVVGIHSPGGNVWDGLAIFNQLRSRKGRVTVRIDGIAASIASVIAMAGGRIVMAPSSRMMVHNPYALAMGGSAAMRKAADELDRVGELLANIYAERSGATGAEIRDWMDAETWFNADEALAAGFCDSVDEQLPMAASASGFDLTKFKRVPRALTTTTNNQKQTMKRSPILHEADPGGRSGGGASAAIDRSQQLNNALSLANQHGIDASVVAEIFANGGDFDTVRDHILTTKYKAKAVTLNPNIGMSRAETASYSVTRALNLLASLKPLDGLEAEASKAVAAKMHASPQGFFIPHDVATRSLADAKNLSPQDVLKMVASIATLGPRAALTTGSAAGGGYTVGTDVLTSSLIDLLRNKMLVGQLGATMLTGLVGDVAIPRHTGGATAYWLDETSDTTASQQTFGQLALTPKRLAANTAYSKQLLAQSSLDIEAFVRMDLMTVLAIEKDRACLNGLNAAGEPLGILNTTGIGSVTFGAAATRAKCLAFQTAVANANAMSQRGAYISTPSTAAVWMAKEEAANTASWLWQGNIDQGVVCGRPAFSTKNVPSDKVIFADWSDLVIGDWQGIDVVVDPYTLASTHQVRVVVNILTDNGLRHVGAVCISSDSGAQ